MDLVEIVGWLVSSYGLGLAAGVFVSATLRLIRAATTY